MDLNGIRRLTPRQIELIGLLVEGHGVESAAAVMGIRHQVAKNMLWKARERAQVTNNFALVGMVATWKAKG